MSPLRIQCSRSNLYDSKGRYGSGPLSAQQGVEIGQEAKQRKARRVYVGIEVKEARFFVHMATLSNNHIVPFLF